MKQVLIKQGRAIVERVPAPQAMPGTVLVRVDHSCISVGTELSGLKASEARLWKRALNRPEKVKRVLEVVAEEGVSGAHRRVRQSLSPPQPAGYSAAGFVIEVGKDVDDLRPGDRVACAGAQCAYHAEVIRVPRNLTVPVPAELELSIASTATLGAIALQGVRRAQPTLGETFVVIGLGSIGQLSAQILRASGCKIIGSDVDRARVRRAEELGMEFGIHPDDGNDLERVARITDGIGADGVIITAATPSNEVISTAFRMCRKKARVVLVGDVGLDLDRADFYEKELDFFISSSYGPGRYDNNYEERGLDYPVSYVRWTENRNLSEYLGLIRADKIQVAALIDSVYPVDEAAKAYEALSSVDARPLIVLLSYPSSGEPRWSRAIANPVARAAKRGNIRIAVVGAGSIAKAVHLPNLTALADRYHIQAVVSRTGHNAAATAKQFAANYSTTDYEAVLDDLDVDAVLISTRHDLHASMVISALTAGKHVLVEKPLALTRSELDEIRKFYESPTERSTPPPLLMTGFNRRFSPLARRIGEIVLNRTNPMIINYRMNAGYIPLDHWVHTDEGGGRNLGEACHIYDLFTYLTGAKVVAVNAQAIRPKTDYYGGLDNFIATMSFADGSVATLTYTALGAEDYSKERLDVFVEGQVLSLDDYRRLNVSGPKAKAWKTRVGDKGHKAALRSAGDAIATAGEWPIALWQQIQATEIALEVEDQLRGGGR